MCAVNSIHFRLKNRCFCESVNVFWSINTLNLSTWRGLEAPTFGIMPNSPTTWAIRARHLLSHVFEYWLWRYRYFVVKLTFEIYIYICVCVCMYIYVLVFLYRYGYKHLNEIATFWRYGSGTNVFKFGIHDCGFSFPWSIRSFARDNVPNELSHNMIGFRLTDF